MTSTLTYTERELVERAARGCRESFDAIVDRHYRGVYAHAYRMLGNPDDAADATQIAFMKAHRSIGEFDTSRPFRPWLSRICGNACIDIARGRHRSDDSLEKHAYMLEGGERPQAAAEQAELQRTIRSAIRRLPERYRRIIVLRHYEQMDVEEIAEVVGAPEGTIKSWLFRARAILRRELQPIMETNRNLDDVALGA
ncbi:MAG: sigma-70 family RNA polymerase sigma factor [Armatimonadetes bacterium]|nr:sigma-70 family RNA polymerase sigma factor [Armatimonadota bacterium]